MPTQCRALTAKLLAAFALAGAGFALYASCGAPQPTTPSELVSAMAERSAELRETLEDHHRWFTRVELNPGLAAQELDDSGRARAEISELLDSLYALEACEKDGWSREPAFISELVGQLEQAINVHLLHVAEAETALELKVEEGVYATKIADLLDALDSHIERARSDAETRSMLLCERPQRPELRLKNVPLI